MASSRNHLYFNDRPTSRSDVEALRAAETLRELYAYDPVPSVLTPEEATHVKGVTGAISLALGGGSCVVRRDGVVICWGGSQADPFTLRFP